MGDLEPLFKLVHGGEILNFFDVLLDFTELAFLEEVITFVNVHETKHDGNNSHNQGLNCGVECLILECFVVDECPAADNRRNLAEHEK